MAAAILAKILLTISSYDSNRESRVQYACTPASIISGVISIVSSASVSCAGLSASDTTFSGLFVNDIIALIPHDSSATADSWGRKRAQARPERQEKAAAARHRNSLPIAAAAAGRISLQRALRGRKITLTSLGIWRMSVEAL